MVAVGVNGFADAVPGDNVGYAIGRFGRRRRHHEFDREWVIDPPSQGIRLVEAVASRWRYERGAGTATTWFELQA
jgi:hypothetical protein